MAGRIVSLVFMMLLACILIYAWMMHGNIIKFIMHSQPPRLGKFMLQASANTSPATRSRFHGVRGKMLTVAILLALGIMALMLGAGAMLMERVRVHFATSYISSHVELKRLNLFIPVQRELVLAQKMADSPATRAFMRDDANPSLQKPFFADAESFRKLFTDHSYFVSSAQSRHFFFNDDIKPFSAQPRYKLSSTTPADSWFFSSLKRADALNLNVNHDEHMKVTKVWINVMVTEGGHHLGIVGTGLDLTRFLHDYVRNSLSGVSSLIIDRQGAILAHANPARIAYNLAGKKAQDRQTLAYYLTGGGDVTALNEALRRLQTGSSRLESLPVTLDGKPQILALAMLPELGWFTVSAIDPMAGHLIDSKLLWGMAIAILMLVLLTLLLLMLGVDHLVLKPIARLTGNVRQLAAGNYDVKSAMARNDEIGELAHVFDEMAQQVRTHTLELEDKVSERTLLLSRANSEMAEAHKKINDNIRYASLIQHGILPDRVLQQTLAQQHALLWLPRDVVSGDLYVFVPTRSGYLFGLIDCAGHGVSAALMTMLAHAAFQNALVDGSADDPAGLLMRMDALARTRFSSDAVATRISSTMDAAFCHIDRQAGSLTFAGAHMDLYCVDASGVHVVRGARRALGEKRVVEAINHTLPLSTALSLYLSSDGLLDQNGGEAGYGFGRRRFEAVLNQLQALPWTERSAYLQTVLTDYQQALPQMDDIAVFGIDASLPLPCEVKK
ncbi:HAMP domain-containing protein [Rhodobacteraceae bacterium CH30]|nr:HAMP domain-containing protein [Rhodobacteraceae bacterium CH30]